jgi:major type 1 subunit fimbrin (pilin)
MPKLIKGTLMKKTLLAAALIAGFGIAAVAPQVANAAGASGGTITFSGSIVSSTCAVTVGGSNTSPSGNASATVTLPSVVAVDTTLTTAGSSAGWTAFTLNLTGCPSSLTGYSKVYPYFTGSGIDTGTGYLTNTGTANSGVEVALSTSSTGASYLTLGSASGSQGAGTVAISSTASSFTYYAGYVATAVPVVAGAVTATVQYNLNYQ